MTIARRLVWIALVLVCCMGCDRVSKSYMQSRLADQPALTFLGDTVRLQLQYNEGAFLSLGASLAKPWREALLRAGVACLLAGLLVYALFFAPSRHLLIGGASLIFAGGASNLLDRFIYDGRVLDFMSIGLGSLRTGVFNAADVAITVGVAAMLWPERRRSRG